MQNITKGWAMVGLHVSTKVSNEGAHVQSHHCLQVSPISAEEMRLREKAKLKGKPTPGASVVQLAVARSLGDYELKVRTNPTC